MQNVVLIEKVVKVGNSYYICVARLLEQRGGYICIIKTVYNDSIRLEIRGVENAQFNNINK